MVIIRLSGFVVRDIPVPEQGREFVYDGREKVGVDEFFAYTIVSNKDVRTTWSVGVDADNYEVTVRIAETAPYGWGDVEPGSATYHGDRKIKWKIVPHEVAVPKTYDNGFVYKTTTAGGTVTYSWNAYENQDADSQGRCWTELEPGAPSVHYCTVSGYRGGDAGDYWMKCVLNNDTTSAPNVTNFIWSISDRLGEQKVPWSIAQADNAITKLTLDNWQEGTTNKMPAASWTWEKPAASYGRTGTVDVVQYQWRSEEDSSLWSELKDVFDPPTEAGRYKLRAYICKDSNHTPGNWVSAEREITFVIWRHPVKTFSNYIDIQSTGSSLTSLSSGLTDFPVLVRLKEPTFDAYGAVTGGLPGFKYSDVHQNGYELRFVSVSNLSSTAVADCDKANPYARDTLLPYEVDSWDPSGESLVWVKVPKMWRGATFRMYWRLKPNAELKEDLKPFQTWSSGYVGVWHLNGLNSKGLLENSTGVDPLGRDSTLRDSRLDATGAVSFVSAKTGANRAVNASGGDLMAPNYQPMMPSATSPFTMTGWYRGDGYATGGSGVGRANYMFTGKKQRLNPGENTGWCISINNNTAYYLPYANNANFGNKTVSDVRSNWHQLCFIMPATGSSQTGTFYFDGGNSSTSGSKTMSANDYAYMIVGQTCSADEVRIASVARDSNWVKAEYDTVNTANFCTFGLVNEEQADGTRAWVNWWSVAPWSAARGVAGTENGQYWKQGVEPKLVPVTVTNSYFGKLASVRWYRGSSVQTLTCGTVGATYTAMPSGEVVVFPTELGPYVLTFTMANLADGPTPFTGPHVIFEGDRKVDIEIVEDRPTPIDPTGGGGGSDAVNLRVLLANDDIRPGDPANSVTNQEYGAIWWDHLNSDEPPELFTNLQAGAEHHYTNAAGRVLWRLKEAYLGNLLGTNENYRTLPSGATASANCQVVLQNAGDGNEGGTRDAADEVAGAEIRSPWYTNGVGTIYFDALNAYVTNAASAFRLVVEVSTNAVKDVPSQIEGSNYVWQALTNIRVLKFTGSAFTQWKSGVDTVELNCNDPIAGDNVTNRFFRVIAEVPSELKRQPLRFRIHRISHLGDENFFDLDDPRGFILIDNVIASWPTAVADFGTPGAYDSRRVGKEVLGWERAFSVDYPSATESNLYAYARYVGDPSLVTSARLHWNWRYLDYQRTAEEVLYLDPANGFKSIAPIPLPGVPGDLEYWYDLTAVVPFYEYCDYSGCGAADPTLGYTENPDKGLKRRRTDTTTSSLPSHGNDWFIRLRDGESDYATMRLVVQLVEGGKTNATETIPCFLCGNHLWRGFLRTGSAYAGKTLRYRFEAQKGTETFSWYGARDLLTAEDIPNSPELTVGSADDWSRIYCDSATGYLLFQLDDHAVPPALTVTRADYCDFNGWSDAASDDDPPFFTGSAIENEKKSGTSSKTLRLVEDFDWNETTVTPDLKPSWHVDYASFTIDAGGRIGFSPFSSADVQGNWKAYDGQWVARFYHPTDNDSRGQSGAAVQLFGLLGGRLELANFGPTVPRGLGTLSFTARAAQSVDFYDFAHAPMSSSGMKDYTFLALATFDQNSNLNFAGNASLSLVAFYSESYRNNIGCYEARWEQLKGAWDKNTSTFKDGPARSSQRLCLYRWAKDSTGNIDGTLLGAITNNGWFNIPKTVPGSGGKYMPFFISAHTDAGGNTHVSAGVLRKNDGVGLKDAISGNWTCVHYIDNSPNHPKGGSYGVLSANCEGVFAQPSVYSGHATVSGAGTKEATFERLDNKGVTFAGSRGGCRDELYWWAIDGERTMDFDEDDNYWGLYALKPEATLKLWLGDANGSNWQLAGSRTVSGFGTNLKPGEEDSFVIRSVQDRTVRLEAESAFADVVLTDVQFTQWRGDNFGTAWGEGDAAAFTRDVSDSSFGYRNSIVFTSGLVVDELTKESSHAIRLSAKRTSPDKPASVRSPFFDGGTGRGSGLGMIAFTYENAQKNANVLVQVATNDLSKGDNVKTLTEEIRENGGGTWTTVTNFDFSACSDEERRRGVRSFYVGLHGAVGLMRIVLDPKLVHNVQTNGVTDTQLFGEIDITKFVVRDEPELTAADWWGWNVRAVSSHEPDNSVGDNLRAYLPDGDYEADARGMPIALNNLPTADVRDEDKEIMPEHIPFVQTPTFTNNVVGEVYFKARRYDNGDGNKAAELTLYGSHPGIGADDSQWTELQTFDITNVLWETYAVRTPGAWSAFRFAVKGGDRDTNDRPRVLLDEVMVFEAVNPTMGFRYVYPFRDGIDKTTACTNVVRFLPGGAVEPLAVAQPLCNESWTVQAEIEKRQLPDEIDMTTHPPRVFFHWYDGPEWGYAKWRDLSAADGHHVAELAPADGESLTFRGSLVTAPEAVVPASLRSPTVVQYSADIVYFTTSGTELTNSLVVNASTAWVKPPWYEPLDYNKSRGKGKAASAYTILETIAPGRVWINEVNLWDGKGVLDGQKPGETNQYVEIAMPELQTLEGWRLDYIDKDYNTNTLCRFSSTTTGSGYVTPKKDLKDVPVERLNEYRTNDYVFLTVQSPKSLDAKAWSGVKGAIDGTWANFDEHGGSLMSDKPIALRLLRPSQIVEQEIVVVGTNNVTGRHQISGSVTNYLAKLVESMPNGTSKFYIAGDEYANRPDQSLGVIRGTGATSNDWTSAMEKTPGRVNEGQIVPYGYVLYPNGELMILRTQIGPGGHVLQAFGDKASATPDRLKPSELTLMIKKGGEGTNITYQVANWWEVESITTNGVALAGQENRAGTFTLPAVGAGLSNDVTVVVKARPRHELAEEYGLTKENPYTPAVMAWLEGGKNYWDEDFENPGELHLAALKTAFSYTFVTNLDLTTMYWLDMDPTASNLVLRAGVVDISPLPRTNEATGKSYTHLRLKLHMEMTNETTHAAWAPYVLRGLEPGVTTADYTGSWTSETFKVTGALVKDFATMSTWVPLKWYTFKPDGSKANRSASFGYTEEADGVYYPYRAKLDVWDPKDYDRAIWTKEWSRYPEAGLWFRWAIDDRGVPMGINPLLPDSTFID